MEAYRPDDPKGPTLVMKKGEATLDLVLGKSRKTEEWSARLISLLDASWFPSKDKMLKEGDQIQIREFDYKVVDITRREVLIQDAKTGEKVKVGMVTRAELTDLRYRLQQKRQTPR